MLISRFFGRVTKIEKRKKTEDQISREKEERYYKIIDECSEEEENVEIYHGDYKHTAYVLKTIFMHAENEVCIFTYGFNDVIFRDKGLILEAIKFLKKPDAILKIAFKDPDLNKDKEILNGEFLKSVLNASTKGKVEIWDASKVTQSNDSYFWLNDRYHLARGPQNDIANFGNKEVGKKLNNLFIEIIIKSERVLN